MTKMDKNILPFYSKCLHGESFEVTVHVLYMYVDVSIVQLLALSLDVTLIL